MTPELLLPAGNLEKLKFAIAYGADAIYAGVPAYSLRTRENEFNVGFWRRQQSTVMNGAKKSILRPTFFRTM
jgi:collagenase-like PrtC family protease